MKRCMSCDHESEVHATTCAYCGESNWIDLAPLPELELVTVPDSPVPLKRNR
jgi:hypothetical protein